MCELMVSNFKSITGGLALFPGAASTAPGLFLSRPVSAECSAVTESGVSAAGSCWECPAESNKQARPGRPGCAGIVAVCMLTLLTFAGLLRPAFFQCRLRWLALHRFFPEV